MPQIPIQKISPKMLLRILKMALGSCLAIYIAQGINLEFASSAGSIALLTVVTTKWGTVRLSLSRVLGFWLSGFLACVTFWTIDNEWAAYGVYILLMALLCQFLGLAATISVNAVIGTHFLTKKSFGLAFLMNEFLLVLIGISIAVILNLFHGNLQQERKIRKDMHEAEAGLQHILGELAGYLTSPETDFDVWKDLEALKARLSSSIKEAREYQDNTFHSHPQYYIDYFEMRLNQCRMLVSLHYEMHQIRSMPGQARIIAEYMLYLKPHVIEINEPSMQLARLWDIFAAMKEQPLPVTREEFENRALLYHVLMDLEEFLKLKQEFVSALGPVQLQKYWNRK